jgi:K+/H+ antiporter YhaU regulatory subunit KhtT
VLYGRDGLPVLTHDGRLQGWLTRADVLAALTDRLSTSEPEIRQGAAAADWALGDPNLASHRPTRPLPGYEMLEVRVPADSPARGKRISEINWPSSTAVVALTQGREVIAARPDLQLRPGERVLVLSPVGADR